MRKISGLTVGLLAFVATGAIIVVPGLVPPASAATRDGASATFAAPAPSFVTPRTG